VVTLCSLEKSPKIIFRINNRRRSGGGPAAKFAKTGKQPGQRPGRLDPQKRPTEVNDDCSCACIKNKNQLLPVFLKTVLGGGFRKSPLTRCYKDSTPRGAILSACTNSSFLRRHGRNGHLGMPWATTRQCSFSGGPTSLHLGKGSSAKITIIFPRVRSQKFQFYGAEKNLIKFFLAEKTSWREKDCDLHDGRNTSEGTRGPLYGTFRANTESTGESSGSKQSVCDRSEAGLKKRRNQFYMVVFSFCGK